MFLNERDDYLMTSLSRILMLKETDTRKQVIFLHIQASKTRTIISYFSSKSFETENANTGSEFSSFFGCSTKKFNMVLGEKRREKGNNLQVPDYGKD